MSYGVEMGDVLGLPVFFRVFLGPFMSAVPALEHVIEDFNVKGYCPVLPESASLKLPAQ